MTTTTQPQSQRTTHDARGFWRVLLALVLPLPWLAKGIQYLVQPSYPDTATQIRDYATHHSYAWLQWFDTVFVILVVPSMVSLGWLARRGAPRLSTAAVLILGTGFLGGISRNLNSDVMAWVAAQKHYDPALISHYTDDLEAEPIVALGGLLFIVGLVFGSIILGLALWRSEAVRPWVAAAVGIGGATHPFLQFSHVVVAIGLWLLAAGCVGASARLVSMTNDEFDLPPL
jgi:hypothetical protein